MKKYCEEIQMIWDKNWSYAKSDSKPIQKDCQYYHKLTLKYSLLHQ